MWPGCAHCAACVCAMYTWARNARAYVCAMCVLLYVSCVLLYVLCTCSYTCYVRVMCEMLADLRVINEVCVDARRPVFVVLACDLRLWCLCLRVNGLYGEKGIKFVPRSCLEHSAN